MSMKLHQLYDALAQAREAGNTTQAARLQAAIDARTAFIGADADRLSAAHQRDVDALAELERNHPELFQHAGAAE